MESISAGTWMMSANKIDEETITTTIIRIVLISSLRNFILDTMGGYNESLVNSEEDYELWLRIINYTNFMMLSDYLVIKGVRTDSYSMRTDRIKKQKVYLLQNSIYSKSNFPEYVQSKRFLGWRELFYGNKNESRKILLKLGPKLLISPKIILAIVITTLPEKVVRKILKYNIKLRLLYYQKYFSQKSINIRKEFNKIVKNHSLDMCYIKK
jgi:hypothetical protein